MATLFQHSNGTYYIKFSRPGGKEIRLSLRTKNKAVAKKQKHRIERQVREGRLAASFAPKDHKDAKLTDFYKLWKSWAETKKSRRTVERMAGSWKRLLQVLKDEFDKEPTHLSQITSSDVRGVLDHLLTNGKSKSTVNGVQGDIRALYNHAIKTLEVYEGANPAVGIKKLKTNELPPPTLSEEQAAKLLKAARDLDEETPDSPRMEWFFLLGLEAGLRLDEIVNCQWSWFDFKAKTVTVASGAGFTTKSGKTRTIPMTKIVRETLLPHAQDDGYLFTSKRAVEEGTNRYRYDPRKRFAVVCARAGLKEITHFGKRVKVTPHVLRYTFGSLRAQKGVSFGKLKEWLGHHSVTVTEKHYLHLARAYDRDIEIGLG